MSAARLGNGGVRIWLDTSRAHKYTLFVILVPLLIGDWLEHAKLVLVLVLVYDGR